MKEILFVDFMNPDIDDVVQNLCLIACGWGDQI